MPRRDSDPDFVESIARGFDVLKAFDRSRPAMSLSEVATVTGLARPTARRILRTLEMLGYVRSADGTFRLTPRVLELGVTYVESLGLWEVARPHLEDLVARTHESSFHFDRRSLLMEADPATGRIAVTSSSRWASLSPTTSTMMSKPPAVITT